MAVTNFLVSTLPDYVQNNRDLIIKSFALANTGTRARIGIQTGIKKSAYLNYMALTAVFQDGSSCGFNPLDEINLGQKAIEVATIKVDGEICPETLLGKWAEPEEIADLAWYLTVVNRSITGEDILIDNGEMLKSNFIW